MDTRHSDWDGLHRQPRNCEGRHKSLADEPSSTPAITSLDHDCRARVPGPASFLWRVCLLLPGVRRSPDDLLGKVIEFHPPAASLASHLFERLIRADRLSLREDSLCLLDQDPRIQCGLKLDRALEQESCGIVRLAFRCGKQRVGPLTKTDLNGI